jgi:hypothetical protein
MASHPAEIARLWPEVAVSLTGGLPVELESAAEVGPRVWRLRLDDGRQFALKFGVETAPAPKEAAVLAALATCPVSRVVAHGGPRAGWLLTEWAGDHTLDSALPALTEAERVSVGMSLVQAVLCVEESLERRARIDAGRREQARQVLAQQTAVWTGDALNSLLWLLGVGDRGSSLSGKVKAQLRGAIEGLTNAALSVAPRLGSLDYNPRNVVLGPGNGETESGSPGLTLIDFPAVGFDWTERRLAQYGTATDAREAGGRFASALDARAAVDYSERAASLRGIATESVLHALDAHEALLLLIAASQLALVEHGEALDERASAWANVPERKEGLRTLLRRSLAAEGPAAQVRALLQ